MANSHKYMRGNYLPDEPTKYAAGLVADQSDITRTGIQVWPYWPSDSDPDLSDPSRAWFIAQEPGRRVSGIVTADTEARARELAQAFCA